MVGKIADIISVWEHNGKSQCVERLRAGLRLVLASQGLSSPLKWLLKDKVVFVVGDVGGHTHPGGTAVLRFHEREEKWLHAKVELAVRFLTVDDVEAVRNSTLHTADLCTVTSRQLLMGWTTKCAVVAAELSAKEKNTNYICHTVSYQI